MLTIENIAKGYRYLTSTYKSSSLIYNSIDIRESSFKTAPVDNNIFPAGFNNISTESIDLFMQEMRKYFQMHNIKSVILLCEEHTRNAGYLRNVTILLNAIKQCEVHVEMATFITEDRLIETDVAMVKVHKIDIFDGKIGIDTMQNPDLIILNNDLSGKDPQNPIMQDLIKASNVIPNANLGWHKRKKSDHFVAYQNLAQKIADECNFDSWLINAYFTTAECQDFNNTTELAKLADATSDLLRQIKAKYKEYKITTQPAVFLKSESGTYGLGVEKINEAKDLLHPNRTFRKNIIYSKSKIPNTQFLLQEAVPTAMKQDDMTAERTIYTSFGKAFGGFYRIHKDKTSMENLNSKGAIFTPIKSQEITDIQSPIHFVAMISSYAVINEINE